MAEFPRVHWKTIDRDNVPFTKPQHYKKDSETETELTGHDNPLPVANYVLNDGGVWIPISKDDPMPTQVIGSNVEDGIVIRPNKDFKEVTVSDSDLQADSEKIYDIYADEGEIWTLMRFGYRANRNVDAEGKHRIWVYHGEGAGDERFIISIDGDAEQHLWGTIPGRREDRFEGEINPSESFEMVETLRGTAVLSDRLPIRIRYRNRSDETLPNHTFKMFFSIEKVVNDDD